MRLWVTDEIALQPGNVDPCFLIPIYDPLIGLCLFQRKPSSRMPLGAAELSTQIRASGLGGRSPMANRPCAGHHQNTNLMLESRSQIDVLVNLVDGWIYIASLSASTRCAGRVDRSLALIRSSSRGTRYGTSITRKPIVDRLSPV